MGLVGASWAYLNSAQPDIKVTEETYQTTRNSQNCVVSINYSFVLVNAGSANGFATVALQADFGGQTAFQPFTKTYYMMAGQQIPVSGVADLPGPACPTSPLQFSNINTVIIDQYKA